MQNIDILHITFSSVLSVALHVQPLSPFNEQNLYVVKIVPAHGLYDSFFSFHKPVGDFASFVHPLCQILQHCI